MLRFASPCQYRVTSINSRERMRDKRRRTSVDIRDEADTVWRGETKYSLFIVIRMRRFKRNFECGAHVFVGFFYRLFVRGAVVEG